MSNAYVNLFSPDTWERFREFGCSVSGFRERQKTWASKIGVGDKFVCYLTGYSRWCGLLEVTSPSYLDDAPIFSDPDPFIVRFNVSPIVVLSPENAVPISNPAIWPFLTFTKDVEPGSSQWTGRVRSSLTMLNEHDAVVLERSLREQASRQVPNPITEAEARRVARKRTIVTLSGDVEVEVPEEEDEEEVQGLTERTATESRQIQADLASLGAKMGFHIWIPNTDRAAVSALMDTDARALLLPKLPLNYDDATLRTIEQIDVIWLRGRAMARAFEVEHTTAIYSGILRMADLLALQPNINIRLHIVAPDSRRAKVLQEIRRPVFSLLSSGPLYDRCTYLSYSSFHELASIPHVRYMKDSIIDEFDEGSDIVV